MDIYEAIRKAITGKSLLFLGAGASRGATNSLGQPIPTGPKLAEALATKCNLPPDTTLDRAADIFLEDFGAKALIELLLENITATSIAKHHEQLAKVEWLRVYTTNYDNVYELSREKIGCPVKPVLLSQRPESVDMQCQVCLHVNGSIMNLCEATLQNEFKLSTTSYLTQHFHESSWIDSFRTDLRLADSIIFVGYSMFDLDIQRLVFATPEIKAKTFCIRPRKSD